jgi:3-oxoacyl-[acyl-carrier-protein] synthase II
MVFPPLDKQEVWITGIGLVSSLGEGLEAHWQTMTADHPEPVIDKKTFAPYSIHPLCELDFSTQIPKRGDLRQMEDWQRIGTYAAGLALGDAGIKGKEELLGKTHIIVAAGNGERDPEADAIISAAINDAPNWRERLNDLLLTNLRPTLYLAQQTQLLAGNISIVHKVTAGSRSFKGEEIAGVQIIENAVNRLRAGQGDLFLVGASCNAARPDQLLIRELNGCSDIVTGSMGAFLVIERAEHARQRGATPYAGIDSVKTAVQTSTKDISVEMTFVDRAEKQKSITRNLAALLGHGIEAQFPFAVAVAALASSKNAILSPFSGEDKHFAGEFTAIVVDCQSAGQGQGQVHVSRVIT